MLDIISQFPTLAHMVHCDPVITPIVIGIVGAAAGLGQKYVADKKQDKNNEQIASLSQQSSQASAKAEAARNQQMTLDAQRQKRQLYRQAVVARSQALSRSVGTGGSAAEGQQNSAFGGATAQISAQLGYGTGNINENQQLGQTIFDTNQQQFQYQSQASYYGSQNNKYQSQANLGQALFQTGTSIVQNAATSSDVYASLFGGSSTTSGWGATVNKA